MTNEAGKVKTGFLRCSHFSAFLCVCLLLVLSPCIIHSAEIQKANNIDALNLTSSWIGGVTPSVNDVALWNATVTGDNAVSLGADDSWAGIKIVDPGGTVNIADNTLTLGSSGIDMSSATRALYINSALDLKANQIWNVVTSKTLTINGAISGNRSIEKTGSGTLRLGSDSNSFSGGTTVTAGTLVVGTNSSTGSLPGDVINNSQLTFNRNTDYTYDGVISGTGSVTKEGTNSLTITAIPTGTGSFVVNNGTVIFDIPDNPQVNGLYHFSDVTVNTGATIVANDLATLYGWGNTIGKTLTLNGGKITTADNISAQIRAKVIMNGGEIASGTPHATLGTWEIDDTVTVIGTDTSVISALQTNWNDVDTICFNVVESNGVLDYSGTIALATPQGEVVKKIGPGSMIMSGENTFTGGVHVAEGAVVVKHMSALGDLTTGTQIESGAAVHFDGGGTLISADGVDESFTINGSGINGTGVINNLSGEAHQDGTIVLQSNSFIGNATTEEFTFFNDISGAGTLTKVGSGPIIFKYNNSYTGPTIISEGKLSTNYPNALGTTAGNTTVNSGATFGLWNNISVPEDFVINGNGISNVGAIHSISGTNTISGTVTIAVSSVVGVDDGSLTISSPVDGTTLSKVGNGELILSADNTLSGNYNVISGKLTLNGANSVAEGVNVQSGGVLSGSGSCAGATVINANGIIEPGDNGPGKLTIDNHLTLSKTCTTKIELGTISDTIVVTGNFAAGGRVNITAGPGFGPGVYTILTYDGSYDANGVLSIGDAPSLYSYVLSKSDGLITITVTSVGADIVKENNTTNLNFTSSWVGGVVPGEPDFATWNSTVTSANPVTLGSDASWGGIKITDPGGEVRLSGNTLTLGGGGIDMSTATQSLTISSDIALGEEQEWNVAKGNILSINSGLSGAYPITKFGEGVLRLRSDDITISGGITISDGTLVIGTSGVKGSLPGNVVNNSALEFNLSKQLTVAGVISGTGTVTQKDTGTITLTGDNTYSGVTTVSTGVLQAGHDNALGTTTAGTTVESGAQLLVTANLSNIFEPLTLNGDGIGEKGALYNSTGTGEWDGDIQIASASTIGDDGAIFRIYGDISGASILTTAGIGQVCLYGDNEGFTGSIFATCDITTIDNSNSLGAATMGTVVEEGATVNLNSVTIAEPFSLVGTGYAEYGALYSAGSPTLTGSVTLMSDSRISSGDVDSDLFTLAGDVSGDFGFQKTGDGILLLSGSNSFTGAVLLLSGVLRLSSDSALGTTDYGTSIDPGTEVQLQGGVTIEESFTLSGSGINNSGAIRNLSDENTIKGNLFLMGATSIGNDVGHTFILDGPISGDFAFNKVGKGPIIIRGENTHGGVTTVEEGVLWVGSGSGLGETSANTVVNAGGAIGFYNGTTVAEPLVLNGAGYLESGALYDAGGNNSLLGSITINSASTINVTEDTLTLIGALAGSSALVKKGTGILRIVGDNSYTGTITLQSGEMSITANSSSCNVNVNSGATISGFGIIDSLVVDDGGIVSPGLGAPDKLTVGSDVVFSSGSIFEVQIGSTSDTLAVANSITLDGVINIDSVAGFGPGTYTIMQSLAGSITNNTLTIGENPGTYNYSIEVDSDEVFLVVSGSNSAPVVTQPIEDTTLNSNFGTIGYRDLNEVFFDTESGTALDFTVKSLHSIVNSTVRETDSVLLLSSVTNAVGVDSIIVSASDGSASVSDTLVVTVRDNVPVLVLPIDDISVNEDHADTAIVDLKNVFTDTEQGSSLSFSIETDDSTLLVPTITTEDSVHISFVAHRYGTANVFVIAEDISKQSVSDTFTVTVESQNDKPEIVTTIDSITVDEDAPDLVVVNLNTVFNDVEDGSNLTFDAESKNEDILTATVDEVTSTLTLFFKENANGVTVVKFSAEDSEKSKTTGTFTVTVTPVNDAPILSSVTPWVMEEGKPTTLTDGQYSAINVDDDILKLIIADGDHYTVDGYTISPEIGYVGSLEVPLSVTDGVFTSNTITTTVEVKSVGVNRPPILRRANIKPIEKNSSHLVTLEEVDAIDYDGDSLVIWIRGGENYSVVGSKIYPAIGFVGTITVPILVTDGIESSNLVETEVSVFEEYFNFFKGKIIKSDFYSLETRVGPNPLPPGESQLSFRRVDSTSEYVTISILDALGTELHRSTAEVYRGMLYETIDLSHLPRGNSFLIYMVYYADDEVVRTERTLIGVAK